MKIYRKTYGVNGLVEWQANIPTGKGSLAVHFAGGSLTAYGVTPATFKTSDPVIQTIIEHSSYFFKKRIFVVEAIVIGEKADPVKAAAPAVNPAPAAEPAPVVEGSKEPEPAEPEPDADPAPGSDETPESEAEPSGEGEAKTMEFACLEDAKQYLMNTYNYTAGAVRYKKDVKQKAAANGLVFIIEGKEL